MKLANRFEKHLRQSFGMIGLGILATAALFGAEPASDAEETTKLEEFSNWMGGSTDYSNWLDIGVGGAVVDGDKAQFQRRQGVPSGAFGGVANFHWEKFVGDNGLLKIDGRGILDNRDYSIKLDLTDTEKGFIRAGFRQSRSWYDGSGGFFPQTGGWFSLYDDELFIDRGEAWIEGGLTLPERPILTFKYSHQFRDGAKDSTIWGDSLQGGFGMRGISPSFRNIDETRDIFQADLKHAFGKTDWGVGMRYESYNQDNSLNMRPRPEESLERFLTQSEDGDSDLFNVHAFTQTPITEKMLFTSGYSFTTLDTDFSGSRIFGADYDAFYDPSFRDRGFRELEGGSKMNQYVLNLNLMATPWESLSLVPSLRVERQNLDSVSHFENTPGGILTDALSDRDFVDVSQRLEARYTGITNWVFYARGDWLEGEGTLYERRGSSPVPRFVDNFDFQRDTDDSRFTQKYTAGANWYPLRGLNLGTQYYHKIRKNDYEHELDTNPNDGSSFLRFPAFFTDHDFETDDVNLRVTWRPFNTLTLISRYDFQWSTVDTRVDGLARIQSSDLTTHILSESITWSPVSRLYFQGTLNYVLDETDTPADDFAGQLILDSQNDYWTASLAAGYALDNKTDIEVQYVYYRADNYVDNSAFSQPYGAGAEEHAITAGLNRRIKENIRWSCKYGYFDYIDETSGGNNNFSAHLVYSSLQWRF